jgi:hypothetical protein
LHTREINIVNRVLYSALRKSYINYSLDAPMLKFMSDIFLALQFRP